MDKIKELKGILEDIHSSITNHMTLAGEILYRATEGPAFLKKVMEVQKILTELEKIQNYTDASMPSKVEAPSTKKEMVNHPLHYNTSLTDGTHLECIDVMEATKGWFKAATFCECNAFKYNWRVGEKDAVPQELGKMTWYSNKAQELWKNNLIWLYPKNGHHYALIEEVKMKNPTTKEWMEAWLYTDGNGMYVREKSDFNKKFKLDKP